MRQRLSVPEAERGPLWTRCEARLSAWSSGLHLSGELVRTLTSTYLPLAYELAQRSACKQAPLVVGVSGSQGSGKSTLSALLTQMLPVVAQQPLSVMSFSIDDLYLSQSAREELAVRVHPLLRTRGVPGTHDVALGCALLDALKAAQTTRLPRFDKLSDDLLPEQEWPALSGVWDVILFEGWCVGAQAQPEAELAAPLNALERDEDPDAVWRSYANAQLRDVYPTLFARLDALVFLQVPNFEQVRTWRAQQEQQLAAAAQSAQTSANSRGSAATRSGMDNAALTRFIAHFERLTRFMLRDLPTRADILVRLDQSHQVKEILR